MQINSGLDADLRLGGKSRQRAGMAAQAQLLASVVLLCWRAASVAAQACQGVGCECVGGWQPGDGWGGTETYLGFYSGREACIEAVKSRNDGADAATYAPSNSACYAEYGQTDVSSNGLRDYENCLFDFTFHAGYCYPQSGAPSLGDVGSMSTSYITGATPQACYNYCETYDKGSGRTAVALLLEVEKWGRGGDPPFCWCKSAEASIRGEITCKRYPSVDVQTIADISWGIVESYICFTEDFDASGYTEFCDDGDSGGGGGDDDSDDNSLAVILGVVAAVVVVVGIVLAYFWKKQKSAKPPSSSGPPPQSAPLAPIKATASEEMMPPVTALAEEAPAAEGWAAATMAEEEVPQKSWRGESMAAEPPPPPEAEGAYAPEAELEPEC